MNIIKEIKRLNEAGSNNTEIERVLGISRKTVRGYLQKLEDLRLSFKDIEKLSGLELQRKLFPSNRGTKKKDSALLAIHLSRIPKEKCNFAASLVRIHRRKSKRCRVFKIFETF